MNYIDQIKAFYDLNEINTWATGQIALWHALMHINKKCNWPEWFSASNQVLSIHTGLSRQGILKARNALKQAGIIDFKAKGTNATLYHMADLTLKSSQAGCQDSCQVSSQAGCQDSCTLNKYFDDDVGVNIYHHARETAFSFLAKYWGRKVTEADIEIVRSKIVRIDNGIVSVDERRMQLLEYAFSCSVQANALNWNYIHGVMDRLKARGIETIDQAYEFDVKRDLGG